MCIYENETFISRLIGWLNFISIIGILVTTDWLTVYSVKVDSTNYYSTFFAIKTALLYQISL